MIAIHSGLAAALPPGAARLVLQIHDEFLLEVAGAAGWETAKFDFGFDRSSIWLGVGRAAGPRRAWFCERHRVLLASWPVSPGPLRPWPAAAPSAPPTDAPLPSRSRPAAEPLLPRVAALVRDCMEGAAAAVRLRVPLRVRLAAGPSWGQLAELQLPPSQRC